MKRVEPEGSSRFRDEFVSDVADGLDEGRRLALDLGAEPADVDVDGARAAVILVTPNFVEQHLAREYRAGVGAEKFQELEFGERQVDFLVADADFVFRNIEGDLAPLDQVLLV